MDLIFFPNSLSVVYQQYPLAVTIGNFDGMHRGHQSLLNRVREISTKNSGKNVVVTFRNHPSDVLRPNNPTPQLCTLQHKIQLLEKAGVDITILFDFTHQLSQQPAEAFLLQLLFYAPFQDLVLGNDAAFGRDRQGSRDVIEKLAKTQNFNVEYISQYSVVGQPVSSSKIRTLVQSGNFTEAERLLGRKYSIYSTVVTGLKLATQLGYPTANLNITGLCLPPFGVYAVKLVHEGTSINGVANLGVAPTVRSDKRPTLEIHLLDEARNLYGCNVEVFFIQHLRPEKYFEDLVQLKAAIEVDIQTARAVFAAEVEK